MNTTPPSATATPAPSSPAGKRAHARYDPNKKRAMELGVWQLRIRRFTFAEIGEHFGIPESTARWWYQEWEQRNDQSLRELSVKAVADTLIAEARQRVQTLNALYRDTKDEKIKLGVMNSLRAEYEHIKETAQSLGLLYREPAKVEVKGLEALAEELRASVPKDRLGELVTGLRDLAHAGNGHPSSN